MPTADLGDAVLHYERSGTGPRLLVISGTGSDTRRPPGPFGWPGADRFDAVAYDHRGLGQSVDLATGQPTMATFAGDALGLVDHLGWERFNVVGISFGGMVAQELALAAGDRIERLVLAVTSPGGAGGSSYPLHEVYALELDDRLEVMVTVMDTRCVDDAPRREQMLALMRSDLGAGAEVPDGLRRQLEARSHHDTWERIGGLQIPTLVLGGRFDGIAELETVSRLAAQIPGAQLEIRDGGHAFLRADRAAWELIAAFLIPPSSEADGFSGAFERRSAQQSST